MRRPVLPLEGDGDASQASAVLPDHPGRRLRAAAERIHRADHHGRVQRIPGGARTLPAVCLARLPVVAGGADRPQAARPRAGHRAVPDRPDQGRARLAIPGQPGRPGSAHRRAVPVRALPGHRPGLRGLVHGSLRVGHQNAGQRREIEALSALIFHAVNNGVYKAGMAVTQAAYEDAFDALFTTLDALEERLARRRFLFGNEFCEADVRLYPTLARFDAVYYIHFKCNLHRLVDYRHLWDYARDLFQRPGFGDTTDFVQIKRHYYQSQDWINPSRIVPKGPYVNWLAPHDRDRLSG